MERHEEIDRLKTRLQWESGGPLAHLVGEATDALTAKASVLLFAKQIGCRPLTPLAPDIGAQPVIAAATGYGSPLPRPQADLG